MTDDELFELFTLIDTLGVKPHDKADAIKRLEKKGFLARKPGHGIELTPAAMAALGKMRMV
jgi:Mn-dependent DtxR family transcriptional regulator